MLFKMSTHNATMLKVHIPCSLQATLPSEFSGFDYHGRALLAIGQFHGFYLDKLWTSSPNNMCHLLQRKVKYQYFTMKDVLFSNQKHLPSQFFLDSFPRVRLIN